MARVNRNERCTEGCTSVIPQKYHVVSQWDTESVPTTRKESRGSDITGAGGRSDGQGV